MIVDCLHCGKQISSKASVCSHCGVARDEVTQEELQETKRRQLRDRIYHLKMTSYLAMSIMLVGFGWYWYASGGFQEPMGRGPIVVMSIGALAYLGIRGLLLRTRHQLKKLK